MALSITITITILLLLIVHHTVKRSLLSKYLAPLKSFNKLLDRNHLG